jgi:hypothetical protein
MNATLFTADHHGYYLNGHPFFPWIQEQSSEFMEESNVVYLRLPASLNDDLHWIKEREQALQIVSLGKYLLWEIDLGLSSFPFVPEDLATFFSFSLPIEEFATQFSEFQSRTFGVILYRGAPASSRNFPLVDWESSFHDCGYLSKKTDSYDLYCTQLLSEYLHRLASFLPESIQPFALIDVRSICSPGRMAQLFSKERFEHVHLALKGATCPFSGICWEEGRYGQGYMGQGGSIPKVIQKLYALDKAAVGLYLPQDPFLDASLLDAFDRLIIELDKNQIPFRIIPEEKLTEQWDEVDQLFIPSSGISAQGKRKLLGFVAAGGSVMTFDKEQLKMYSALGLKL